MPEFFTFIVIHPSGMHVAPMARYMHLPAKRKTANGQVSCMYFALLSEFNYLFIMVRHVNGQALGLADMSSRLLNLRYCEQKICIKSDVLNTKIWGTAKPWAINLQ